MHVRCDNNYLSKVFILLCYFYTLITVELGKLESNLLNIASSFKAFIYYKQLINKYWQVISSMIRARLLEFHYPSILTYGFSLDCNRTYIFTRDWSAWSRREVENTRLEKIQFKDKSEKSKEDLRINILSTGLPKWSNPYGNGINIVPAKFHTLYSKGNALKRGRFIVNFLSIRKYTTGSSEIKSNVLSKIDNLSELHKDSVIDRNLYKLVSNVDLLNVAYENIKSKPGNMTQGISPDTLDGISLETLNQISEKLKNESFKFSPSRRIHIPKNGTSSRGTRQLNIASPRDKIVQEAIRIILNAVYEPIFLSCSHGFRPNKGCHSALKSIHIDFQSSTWFIEGDFQKCFDNINHEKLMAIIETKILDRQFTKLIRKSLKAGYFEFTVYQQNIIGTPQGSIISPILSNIYLHQLDKFILNLKNDFDLGTKARRTKISRYYEYHIQKARQNKDFNFSAKLIADRSNTPAIDYHDPNFKKLMYVRYADDWIVGVRGNLSDAKEILTKIKAYCESINLTINESKTKITNINSEKVLFLGTKIFRATHRDFTRIGKYRMLKRMKLKIRFEAPLDRIKAKLTSAKFIRNGKSNPKFLWLHLDHKQIIILYNSVLRGYLNYYKFVHNYGILTSYIQYILKQSCAKLLAAKYSLGTMAKVYKKYGSNLGGFLKPSYKATYMFNTKATPIVPLYREKINLQSENLICSICGSNYKIEFHHVRAMKDLNPKLSFLDKLMVKNQRKRIPLCRPCHMLKHYTNKIRKAN